MEWLIPQFVLDIWSWFPPLLQYLIETTFWIVFVMIVVILAVAFTTYFERKVIGYMQGRIGPNRVGPKGLGQPFADVLKMLVKEVVVPAKSSRFLFVLNFYRMPPHLYVLFYTAEHCTAFGISACTSVMKDITVSGVYSMSRIS